MAPTLRQVVVDEDSMEVDEPQWVKLKTSDGKRFTLTKSEACCSNALRMMIESFQNTPNASTEYINLQLVNGQMLTKVLEWCRLHCNSDGNEDSDATCTRNCKAQLSDSDKVFLNSMQEEELFNLTRVSNYLDVRSLFDACCQTIAKRWEDKKVEEIRKMYNIENDFTQEEEHHMVQESKKLGMNN